MEIDSDRALRHVVPGRPAALLDYVLSALGIGAAPTEPVAAEDASVALERVAPELRAAINAVVALRHAGAGAPLALTPHVVAPR